ncbi:hypothetical protein [Archaeoglobus sp.]
METKRCPFCGGTMVKGKSKTRGHALYFWKKPWSGILGGVVLAYPWLCLDCGALIPFVERDELTKIRDEFERNRFTSP